MLWNVRNGSEITNRTKYILALPKENLVAEASVSTGKEKRKVEISTCREFSSSRVGANFHDIHILPLHHQVMFKLKKDVRATLKKAETENTEKRKPGDRRPSSAAPKTWPLESAPSSARQTTSLSNSRKKTSEGRVEEYFHRKQGHLWKWTNYLKGWQRRLFILENGIVSYYEEKAANLELVPTQIETLVSSGKLLCRGRINLLLATIVPHDVDVCRFAIDLGKTIYHLRGDTEEVREQWLSSLMRSQAFLQNLLKRKPSELSLRLSNKFSEKRDEIIPQNSFHPSLASNEDMMSSQEPFAEDLSPRSDEIRELQRMKHGLLNELKRVQSKLESTTPVNNTERLAKLMIEIFDQEVSPVNTDSNNGNDRRVVAATQGFSDLISWSIYVLETSPETVTDQQVTHQSSTNFTISNSLDAPFDEDLDDKETELEFFDAEADDSDQSRDEQVSSSLTPLNLKSVVAQEQLSHRRTKLPVHRGDVKRPSLWSVLKDAVGKDVSRISIPVTFNEPLSFLQRMAEDIEYSELLDQASETNDPFQRLLLVSALAVSHYCSAQERIAKPFNPLLGETFELLLPEKNNLKFMSEQVSHHPPISASFAMVGVALL